MSVAEKMTELADAVRELTGGTEKLTLDEMIQNILSASASDIINIAEGEIIQLFDCATRKLRGLTLYGKTTQNGTPTPDAPVALVGLAADGSVTVNVDAQTLNVSAPNGLLGIPVASGGNYTDANGQQWLCDEIDFAKGVYIQRVKKKRVSAALNWGYSTGTSRFHAPDTDFKKAPSGALDMHDNMCTHFKVSKNNQQENLEMTYINASSPGFAYRYDALNGDVNAWKAFLTENEVYIVAELATPIETTLSTDELAAYAKLHTNYPQTTIYNDVGAWMSVQYAADTKNYVDNQIAEVAGAIVSSI